MPEIYISTDVESDGPIPGPNSMLSIGSAAFLADKTMVSTFSANLMELPGASGKPATMEFWQQNQEAWKRTRENVEDPAVVMQRYAEWIGSLKAHGLPVFVAYPAGYDFLFVYWYLMRFNDKSPFSHSALDIKTYAMAMLGLPYRESVKKNMPKRWFSGQPHTHVALEDAIGQGHLFLNMLAENKKTIGVANA